MKQIAEIEHTLTDPEKLELGQRISRLVIEIGETENRKKAVSSEFEAVIEMKAAELKLLTAKYQQGSEQRQMELVVEYHLSRQLKAMYDPTTHECLKQTSMTDAEVMEQSQAKLPLE